MTEGFFKALFVWAFSVKEGTFPMVLSHCLKTDFYNSLTVGLNPKPLVISTIFSFAIQQLQSNTVASSLSYIFLLFIFLFFEEMDRRKSSIFILWIDCFAYPPNYSSNPATHFDCHLWAKRHVAKFHPGLSIRVSEGGRCWILTQQSWKH